MTVSELIQELQKIPGDYPVIVLGQGRNEGCECNPKVVLSEKAEFVFIVEED